MLLTLCKTLILYLAVVVSLRAMGKRQVGELETSELVVTILVSELAAIPMQDPGIPLFAGILPILALLCLEVLLSGLMLKFPALRGLLCGRPSSLIHRGRLDRKELFRQRVSVDELVSEVRLLGYADIGDLEELTLETNGRLSLVPKPGREAGHSGPCVALINSGRPDRRGMAQAGIGDAELRRILAREGLSDPRQALYLYLDAGRRVHVIRAEEGR